MVVMMELGVVRGVLATVDMGGGAMVHGDGKPEVTRLRLELGDVFVGMR